MKPTADQRPAAPLYGVDFSGARERDGRNPKLWVACWRPDGRVTLDWGGGSPGFGRGDLARRIAESPGVWLLDFPFGPEEVMARAMGWDGWEDYLAWSRSDDEVTRLRDAAKAVVEAQGLRWSRRRRIDAALSTTWFPLFEQLYRQTLKGAADVLAPLEAAGRESVRILPWHAPFDDPGAGAQVAEGFPALAIQRLGLVPAGYKGRTERHRRHRARILDALAAAGIPLEAEVRARALDDREGDALDALALLHSAASALERPAADWHEVRRRSAAEGWAVEGWFFD